MGNNYILLNDETILAFNNAFMNAFFEELGDAIIEKGVGDNEAIVEFISELDQGYWGLGCVYSEISKYFENRPNDLSILIQLIAEVAKKFERGNLHRKSAVLDILMFRDKLSEYLKTLKT